MKVSHAGRGRKSRGLDARIEQLANGIGGCLGRGDLAKAEVLNAVRKDLLVRKKRLDRRRRYPADAMTGQR
jgi:hypothetical protein